MTWQKRARAIVAIFGIALAVVVYRSIGTRHTPGRPASVKGLEKDVTIEAGQGVVDRRRQAEQDFRITFDKSLTYADGSTKMVKIRIEVHRSDGRTFVVTADEARAGTNQKEKELTGNVTLAASDGFEMMTDRATHSEDQATVTVPGMVMFKKGHMSGSGVKATYDQAKDVLTMAEQAAVTVTDDAGHPTTEFSAGNATLDRMQHVLTLDTKVHVVRDPQVIDTDHANARLTESNDVVTFMELRGQARVTGGSAIRSMSARDIDMDYSDDGRTLERVVLNGNAEITPSSEGESARSMAGESLDMHLAADGSIVSATGRENVRLDLPASGDSPGGRITAKAMDASGQEGRGLTEARFTEMVEYREPARKNASPRVVHARTLTAALDKDAVTEAVFNGNVSFEEEDLNATAPEVHYRPGKNTIALSGPDAAMASHVTIDQISIDAQRVDVALDSRRIAATQVKTTLRAQAASGRGSRPNAGGRAMPGLLKQGAPANVNANALEYVSETGQATYTGNARLFQDATSISGDMISVDRERGDLLARGSARSTLDLETGRTTGSAHEIRYVDTSRTVTYSAEPVAPTRGRGVASVGPGAGEGAPVPSAREAQVKGPQGDLRAERIEIVLAKPDNRMDRLEAYTRVTLQIDKRSAAADRLTYHAADERYVMTGLPSAPASIISTTAATATTPQSCRQSNGRTLTFSKATETINVDGNAERRTETRNSPCLLPPSR